MSVLTAVGVLQSFSETNTHEWSVKRKFHDIMALRLWTSPVFHPFGDSEKKFKLALRGTSDSTKYLTLHCVKKDAPRLSCKYRIRAIKDDSTVEIRTGHCTFCDFRTAKEIFKIELLELHTYVSRTHGLTICCELIARTGNSQSHVGDDCIDELSSVPRLRIDNLFLDESFSDVALKASCGREIPAHGIVLSSASPAFVDLFARENKSRTSTTTIIDTIDVSYAAVVEMLRHIYTGSIRDTRGELQLIAEILAAADKYRLEKLKHRCEQRLIRELRSENALWLFTLADAHRAKHLKEAVVDLLLPNI